MMITPDEAILESRLPDPKLAKIAAMVGELPVLPLAAMEAMRLLADKNTSAADLQNAIARDPALASEILKIANSAMYGFRCRVSSLSHAIAVIGMDAMYAILIGASLQRTFLSGRRGRQSALMSPLWRHAWGAALTARLIARRCRYRDGDEALTGGLVHDVGKLVMLRNQAESYAELLERVATGEGTYYDLELRSLGFTHTQVGALLALKWSFPGQLIESILHHHDPDTSREFGRLTCIVHLANRMMIVLGISHEQTEDAAFLGGGAAEGLGLGPEDWAELRLEAETLMAGIPAFGKRQPV